MRRFLRFALFAPATLSALAVAAPETKHNVLFIAVDDLRPQTGFYGDKIAKTPNMDKLAATALVFERAYCQQAVCSPSRTSLLTGRRPDSTQVYDLQKHFRNTIPDVVTLPQLFKNNGWHTQSYGKIYHGGLDDPLSWSTSQPNYIQVPETTAPVSAQTVKVKDKQPTKKVGRGASWEMRDVADNELPDGQTATSAIETMRKVKDRSFFLAVGFVKPHLPFVAPRKYFDLYDLNQMPLALNNYKPKGAPDYAAPDFGELRQYSDIPKSGPLPDQKARELVRGYYAATSYTDAQIGRVLDELDKLGLRERTVIVLWGDHGWHLGEHGHWCKHTNFEVATHAPLLLSAPGMKTGGRKSNALVEFVDIYPTLAEACGIELPQGLEGTSLLPLVEDPDRKWKSAAFSQYPRGKDVMGYSMRTDRYRYTEWQNRSTGELLAVELYDHEKDAAENENVALAANNAELTATLSAQMKAGWKSAKP